MEITHGIALFFEIVFIVLAMVFNKVLWWLLNIAYILVVAIMAITNEWEALLFPPLVFFAIISVICMSISALRGDLI